MNILGNSTARCALPRVIVACLVACVSSVGAAEDRAMFSIDVEEFRGLCLADQRALIQAAFEIRLKEARNIRLQAMQRGYIHEYKDGAIGKRVQQLKGIRYRCVRLGDSYRFDWEMGGADVAEPNEFGISGFDVSDGVVKSTLKYVEQPRTFGRVDSRQNSRVLQIRYRYWLDGDRDKKDAANFIVRDALEQVQQWEVNPAVDRNQIELAFPWQPPWYSEPLGTWRLSLVPEKGFLPVQGNGYLEKDMAAGNKHKLWRNESFVVDDAMLVGKVWLPTKLKEFVRASSGGDGLVNAWETNVTKVENGVVKVRDLAVEFPPGTLVVDAIEGVSYVAGEKGESDGRKKRLLGSEANLTLQPTASSTTRGNSTLRTALILINTGVILILGALLLRRFGLRRWPGKSSAH